MLKQTRFLYGFRKSFIIDFLRIKSLYSHQIHLRKSSFDEEFICSFWMKSSFIKIVHLMKNSFHSDRQTNKQRLSNKGKRHEEQAKPFTHHQSIPSHYSQKTHTKNQREPIFPFLNIFN